MTFRTTLHIEAPVEEVFDLFADPEHFRLVSAPGVRFDEIQRTSEGLGTRYRWAARFGPLTLRGCNEFTDFVPGRRITDTSSNALEGTWTYVFEQEGAGTRLCAENQVRGLWHLPLLEQLLDRMTARSHGPVLEQVKAELEHGSST
jgi:uncharacterized protein YndB with AHSA1/START domain